MKKEGKKKKNILHPANVHQHMVRNAFWGLLITALALFIGMLGYHHLEKMSWVDSFMNASMILSGMGPAANLVTIPGKIFAGCYALFSGLAFIAIMVIILSPLIHQFFHKIHLESKTIYSNDQD